MRKYLVYYRTMFKSSTAYKADFLMGLLIDVVFFFISFALWKTVYSEGNLSSIAGYSLHDTITYYLLTALIFRFDVSESIYLNWQVWNGYFTNDLVKPWNIPFLYIIDTIAERSLVLLLYIPVLAVIFFSTRSFIDLPSLHNLIFFGITIIIAFVFNCFFNLSLHALVFRFGDQDANIEFSGYVAVILAGGIFPLAFLPANFKFIFDLLPFRFLFSFPIETFLGKLSDQAIYLGWIEATIWIAIFALIFNLIYKDGLKNYTGTGR